MKSIGKHGRHSWGGRSGAAFLPHALGGRRAKKMQASGAAFGARSRGAAPAAPGRGTAPECANETAIEQMEESLVMAGAILPVRQPAFENSPMYMDEIPAGGNVPAAILPFEHSLAVVYVYSCRQGNRMIDISPQQAYLGFPMEAWLGSTDLRLQQAHEDDFERLVEAMEHSYGTGEKFSCLYRLYDSDRKIHWFHDEARVICDESGAPLFARGLMLDITDNKQMEAELDDHRYRLEEQVGERTNQLMKRMELLESCNASMSDRLAQAMRELAALKRQAIAQPDCAGEYARRMIELTRNDWSVKGGKPAKGEGATLAVPPTDCAGQLEGISEWARNMIGWRVAAAGAIA